MSSDSELSDFKIITRKSSDESLEGPIQQQYEVAAILDCRIKKGEREFKV